MRVLDSRGLLLTLLRGGAVVVALLWAGLSFAPAARIIHDDLSIAQLTIELLFFATGIAGVVSVYVVLVFVATDRTRRALMPSSRRFLDLAGLYAVAWILLYSVAV